MRYLIVLILAFFVFSCNQNSVSDSSVYFGGQIVNPRTNFVLFLKDEQILDTLILDKSNRFLTKYENLDEGLYTFKHGLEFQYIYLEPADSLLVRLNSWDFDESIVYSGVGSAKNEFLLNLFLQNEEEEKEIFSYFKLDENQFQHKIDSLKNVKETIYENFKINEIEISEGFQHLTNVAINYPLYRLKEIYPYYYKKAYRLASFPVLSEQFYDYRKSIDLNNDHLLFFYPYQNYVVNFLYNQSYVEKEKDSTKNDITTNVLNAIVKNVSSEEIKNTLLKRIVVNDFLKSKTTCAIDTTKIEIFLKNCSNQEYIDQVQNLVSDSKYVENNKLLPDFEVVSYNNDSVKNINNIIKNKKTVIYFWSTEYMSSEYLVSRVQFLQKKYPKVHFIGVQMQPAYIDIKTDYKLKKLDSSQQFKLLATSYANNFLTSRYPRLIITNSNGLVMNGFTYLDAKNLEKELNKLQIN
ncbi:hypothetical protein EC396_08040 [Lutibacter sp. HS1-25]|uniref:hypothetical protein n=1 Tax=Lutibacter sp. HS1-25 TaxID=2485000 RepID=UPI001010E63E|nr:hypothetical protein [Lutibacter sp. HS1-25]RXP55772.1 hypothetical protein EC396_08040 [Lutibacter sp. HS1-25]